MEPSIPSDTTAAEGQARSDANGQVLQVGDIVLVRSRIKRLFRDPNQRAMAMLDFVNPGGQPVARDIHLPTSAICSARDGSQGGL